MHRVESPGDVKFYGKGWNFALVAVLCKFYRVDKNFLQLSGPEENQSDGQQLDFFITF